MTFHFGHQSGIGYGDAEVAWQLRRSASEQPRPTVNGVCRESGSPELGV